MIVQNKFKLEPDGWELVRSYSGLGMLIQKDGTPEIYEEAVDLVRSNVQYTETDIPIESYMDKEAPIISEDDENGTA